MISRRLLMSTRGAGGFLAAAITFTITAPPQGAWPWGNAHRYGDYTYVAYTNNAGGIRVAIWDHAAGAEVAPVASRLEADAFTSPDQHNSPALWRRSDGRLLAVYMPHAGANAYRRVTVNTLAADPTISGGWQARTNIDSQLGSSLYTYPDLHSFAAGPILFYRDQDGVNNWEVSQSTDDGATWAPFTNLFYALRAYARSFRSSDTRLDFLVTDGSWAEDEASVYHFYMEAGAPYTTAGVAITGGFPIDFTDMTKVWDGPSHSAGARAPADLVRIGDDVAVVFVVQTGTPSGHIGEDEDYYYARSNAGGAWAVSTVATDVGALTFEFTEGGLVIDPLNLSHLAVSRRAVSDLAYPFRVYDVTSDDGGATWPEGVPISVDDGDSAMYPTFVRDPAAALRLVWLQGPNYTSQSDFSTGIQGYGY